MLVSEPEALMISRLPENGQPHRALADFVRSEAFPCVGAKATLAQGTLHTFDAHSIESSTDDVRLRTALMQFAREAVKVPARLHSFACIYADRRVMSEVAFETALWNRLQALHDLDVEAGDAWAPEVDDDPASSHFSMSIGGVAYFVIGLHPGASRAARRFNRATMIFNLHAQFEGLRADGRFDVIRSIVRAREIETVGDVNPMLGDFGARGEAPQYSGRLVGRDWCCPLRVKS